MAVSQQALSGYVGQGIGDICANGFSSPSQNHCAHFVSHAHGIQLGMLCGDMAFKTRKTGASIRCDELFNQLGRRGKWADLQAPENGTLIFVLSARNVVGDRMQNVPQKHVGIYSGGQVYNFPNSQGKVVADSSVGAFHQKFKRAYAGDDISLHFGIAP